VSITCAVWCLDCLELAPDVGDGGYLGAPSLEPIAMCDLGLGDMPTFGFLYEPLRALDLQPADLEDFREFLLTHAGHRLRQSADEDPPEIAAMDSERRDAQMAAIVDDAEARKTKRAKDRTFVEATLKVRCDRCKEVCVSDEPDFLRSFKGARLAPSSIALFLERWPQDPDTGWNHRVSGIVDPFGPFMTDLWNFLSIHREHSVAASLDRIPSDLPKGQRATRKWRKLDDSYYWHSYSPRAHFDMEAVKIAKTPNDKGFGKRNAAIARRLIKKHCERDLGSGLECLAGLDRCVTSDLRTLDWPAARVVAPAPASVFLLGCLAAEVLIETCGGRWLLIDSVDLFDPVDVGVEIALANGTTIQENLSLRVRGLFTTGLDNSTRVVAERIVRQLGGESVDP
jgi:hypothetical protein